MNQSIQKMSDLGKVYNDLNNPRFFLMVDISPSKKNSHDHFLYASTVNGKIMFTVDSDQLLDIATQFVQALPNPQLTKLLDHFRPRRS